MLKDDRSKAKNSISKNASKFNREVLMPEFENKEDKSASGNAKALKNMIKPKMKSVKEKKWKIKGLHGKYPKFLEKPHVDTVTTKKWLSSNLKGETTRTVKSSKNSTVKTMKHIFF